MPAPTLGSTPTAPQSSTSNDSKTVQAVIPFTRAARKKSKLATQTSNVTLTANTQNQSPLQLPPAGYARQLRITVTGTAAGNSAAVAFANDGPFNALQQIVLLSANGDQLIAPIDGFTLAMINKYFGLGTGPVNITAPSVFSATTGAGATGGSFKFEVVIPFEIDSRDALGALANMAANQAFQLQYSFSPLNTIYTVAPTVAPTISLNAVIEYWAVPATTNSDGVAQQNAPIGQGTVSLIQTQTPPIVANTAQNIQLLGVGNVVRTALFILRTAAGVRTETDWPTVFSLYINGDPQLYKTKYQWRSQIARDTGFVGAPVAAVSASSGAQDNGVYVITDFINDGSQGDGVINGASNRDLWLVTNAATALNIEATTPWGATAGQLLVVQNNIRPSSAAALYAGFAK